MTDQPDNLTLDDSLLEGLEVATGHVQRGQVADEAGLAESVSAMPDPSHMLPLDDAPTPCAFITGIAGSGKTWTVRERCAADPMYAALASSTGISAINLNTITIHSLLGFFDTDSLRDAYIKGGVQTRLRKLVKEGYRNVIIDECSMISRDVLDLLVRAFDDVNGRLADEGQPAVGLILTGDFCLGAGTRVMMFDGSLRKVEDLRAGMQLMGPDFTPRTIQKTCQGMDNLYKVSQTNGDPYIVNSKHRLALKRSVDGSRLERGKYLRYEYMKDDFPLPVEEFVAKSQMFKQCFVGYKAGCISLPPRPVKLDPYFMGIWLGDGDKDCPRITTADPEIIKFCEEFAERYDLKTTVGTWERTSAVRIGLAKKRKGNKENPVTAILREYDVLGNKHIPDDYMYNSVEARLELLAGLIDTDGCWNGNRYTIGLAHIVLAHQIKQLADHLGFRVLLQKIEYGWYGRVGADKSAWNVQIGGDTWRIPCRVARKQSGMRSLGRSRMTSVLAVNPIGVGQYYGFEVDGDSKFLLADGTVTYNCQLPAIADRPAGYVKGKRGKSQPIPWAFRSQFWGRFEKNMTRLTKVWRQADPRFLAALNFARAGRGRDCLQVLQSSGQRFESFVDHDFNGTTIVGKNDEVDRINQIRLDRVKGRLIALPARRWAVGGKVRQEWKHIPERTLIRENCYVMILSNKYVDNQMVYANGDCGWVRGVQASVDKYLPPSVLVELVRTGEVVNVESLVRGIEYGERPDWYSGEWDDQTEDEDGKFCARPHYRRKKRRHVTGQVEYYPLRVCYASTVHKVQGLSIDRCQVDFRGWMYKSPAMTYTALSRCRTLDGLRLVGMPEMLVERCKIDPEAAHWL